MPDYSKLTPESLQKLVRIVERRTKLAENLKEIDLQIDEILRKETATTVHAPAPVKGIKKGKRTKAVKGTKVAKASKPAKTGRKRSGNRADGIIKLLQAAGAEGERVIDIAKKLGTAPQTLHVWFGQTGKRLGLFKKLEPGRYALKEFHSSKPATSAPAASTPAPAPTVTPTPTPAPAPQQPSPYSYQPQSQSPQN